MGRPRHWVEYFMPDDAKLPNLTPSVSSNNLILSDVSKFDQLMTETQTVLSRYASNPLLQSLQVLCSTGLLLIAENVLFTF